MIAQLFVLCKQLMEEPLLRLGMRLLLFRNGSLLKGKCINSPVDIKIVEKVSEHLEPKTAVVAPKYFDSTHLSIAE